MKPASIFILCLACCCLSVGAAYLVFTTLHEPPASRVVANADSALEHDEVADLRHEVDQLRLDIKRLRVQPTVRPDDDDFDTEPADADDVVPDGASTASTAPDTLNDLADRIADIESGEAAARTIRQRAILEINGDDRRARWRASNLLAELARAGDTQAQKALIEAAKSDDANVRDQAVDAMGQTGMVEFLPALIEAAGDENTGVRDEAAEALRRLPPEKAGPVLVDMLDDPEPRVLREAIEAIGDMGFAEGAGALRGMSTHQDEGIAIRAAIALKQLGDPGSAEGWVPTLGIRLNSTDVRERRTATLNMLRLRMPSARPYLEQALNDEDARVRRYAQRALNDLNED